MLIEVLLTGMMTAGTMAASPPESRIPCGVGDEQAGASQAEEPTRWMTNVDSVLALPPGALPGQRISVRDVPVSQVDTAGFWIVGDRAACRLFVIPAEGSLIQVRPGELIDLQGEVRLRSRTTGTTGRARDAYVYAYIVRKAPPRP